LELIAQGIAPATGRKLEEIRAEIFEIALSTSNVRSPRKLLRKPLMGPKVLDWYVKPLHHYPQASVKMDELQMRRREKVAELRRLGKGPPKKGESKRSKRK